MSSNFTSIPPTGAVGPRIVRQGTEMPPPIRGDAPMTVDPHSVGRPAAPHPSPELRSDLQKLPASARAAQMRR
jgi:hypothetical protein